MGTHFPVSEGGEAKDSRSPACRDRSSPLSPTHKFSAVSSPPRPVLRRQNRTAEPQRPNPLLDRLYEPAQRARSQSNTVPSVNKDIEFGISEEMKGLGFVRKDPGDDNDNDNDSDSDSDDNDKNNEVVSSLPQDNINMLPRMAAKKHLTDRPISRKSTGSGRVSSGLVSEMSSGSQFESTMSPSLRDTFSSPLTPTPYASSDMSANSSESIRTIKGNIPQTPGKVPLRTPSYPFPYVPSTNADQKSSSRQSTMSAKSGTKFNRVASETFVSEAGTPLSAASNTPLAPPGYAEHLSEEMAFPPPDLYDIVLRLSSEAGIDAWWNSVTQVLRENFLADRASLAMPADPSDLENVPWGQKASYNKTGIRSSESRITSTGRRGTEILYDTSISSPTPDRQKSRASRKRPNLVLRHSYAGHESQAQTPQAEPIKPEIARPPGPKRLATHAPYVSRPPETMDSHAKRVDTGNILNSIDKRLHLPLEHDLYEEPSTSTPCVARYPVLRALDRELCPLIDPSGINRVLQKGRLITLTRDYAAGEQMPSFDTQTAQNTRKSPITRSKQVKTETVSTRTDIPSISSVTSTNASGAMAQFDEYEQFPTSPWAQSPAPSPAIQNDPEENPFFATPNIDEESFNPTAAADYSKYDMVPAIGVDRASTVIHVPLVHPFLSQMKQPALSVPYSPSESSKLDSVQDRATNVSSEASSSGQRKTPIAILSILSSVVPFPKTLLGSLKLLGPHLATLLSNADQYTNAINQANSMRNQRITPGSYLSMSLDTQNNVSLESLVQFDMDDFRSSTAGSITSPSDYSGCSKNSPGPSSTCTPNWEFPNLSHMQRPGLVSTPGISGGNEGVESYFDTMRGGHNRRLSENVSLNLQQQTSNETKSSPITEQSLAAGMNNSRLDDGPSASKPQLKTRLRSYLKPNERTEYDSERESSTLPTGRQRAGPGQLSDLNTKRPRALLHSFGADFSSSFQSLPAATTPATRLQTPTPLEKKDSTRNDTYVMPPPSERLLRTIIDSLPVQIFTAEPTTGTLTWVNSKFLVYRGKDRKEILEDPWETVHPKDRDKYREKWMNCLRTGQQMQHKFRLQRFDSHYRWFYVRAAPLKDKRQNIVHWIGTNMDIHEQQIAEVNAAQQQETAASEARYRALANSSPQIVFAVTRSRGVVFCNSQWPAYSGQCESEASGLGFMSFIHPEDLKKCKLPDFDPEGHDAINVPTTFPSSPTDGTSSASDRSAWSQKTAIGSAAPTMADMELPPNKLAELASSGFLKASKDADGRLSYSTEVRIRSKDGAYRWHLVRVLLAEAGLKDDGDEETWYGTCTDINDHKVLEQTLKNTMDAKSRFLSNMSHEIRTPLNGITGMVNFLMDSDLTSEQMEHVNIIRASTEGLRDLINDILDLSKVEAGMVTLTQDWFHIRSVIEDVCDLIYPLAIDKGIGLNYVLQETVPSVIKGDKFRIRQVLLNVIGNAIKFTQQGEVFVRCTVLSDPHIELDENETLLQFDVIDTGSGFSEKEAEFLFKRFSQIDESSTRQHGGTGLGLVISMQLVELHGGKMKATSKPGTGSTFSFYVKFVTASPDDQPPPTRPLTKTIQNIKREPFSGSEKQISSQPASNISQKPFSPIISKVLTDSPLAENPTPGTARSSPALSTDSSVHSFRTVGTSIPSTRTSVSSIIMEAATKADIALTLPEKHRSLDKRTVDTMSPLSSHSSQTVTPSVTSLPPLRQSSSGSTMAPMCSVLIVCPLKYSREAAIEHVKMTIPYKTPRQITARKNIEECKELFEGEEMIIFTHVVLVLPHANNVIDFLDYVMQHVAEGRTKLVTITDPAQKREIMIQAPSHDYIELSKAGRLQFIFRPLKPSKLAAIFDPKKQREVSTDQNQNSAQQVAISQKQIFERTKSRVGNRNFRVLLVEDNQVNQVVSNFISS